MAVTASWMPPAHALRSAQVADGLAAAIAISLPWSTSATTILVWLWLAAAFPAFDLARLRKIVTTPAGGFPVLMVVLALVGVVWAFGLPMKERLSGVGPFYKLLFVPLLMMHFQRSERAMWMVNGFVGSCIALLVVSWTSTCFPGLQLPVSEHGGTGVPVKDPIAQNAEFTICIFLLAPLVLLFRRRLGVAIAIALIILAFLGNVFVVTNNRTSLIIIPLLALLFAGKYLPPKGAVGLLLVAVIAGGAMWSLSPPLRTNITGMWSEVRDYHPDGARTRAGERLEFWSKSVGFVTAAPLLGHGTGSIRDQFRRTVDGQSGMAALESSNPHNQILAIAIQFGFVGVMILFAMWTAHGLLFARGSGMAAWAGLVIVAQNVVGSLFNSHLSDFTHGWLYVIGVGVAAGTLLKSQPKPDA